MVLVCVFWGWIWIDRVFLVDSIFSKKGRLLKWFVVDVFRIWYLFLVIIFDNVLIWFCLLIVDIFVGWIFIYSLVCGCLLGLGILNNWFSVV